MALGDITSRQAVLDAVAECDRLGRSEFRAKYGFGRSKGYYLVIGDREYDSKAIVGAAHGFEFPSEGPLTWNHFSGGAARVQPLLERLGFEVRVR